MVNFQPELMATFTGIHNMMTTRYSGARVVWSHDLDISVVPGTFPFGPSIGDAPTAITLLVSAPPGTHYAKYVQILINYSYWKCGCQVAPGELPSWERTSRTLTFKIPEVRYEDVVVPDPEEKTPDLVIIYVENPELDNPVRYSWLTWDVTVANVGYIDSGPFDVSFLVSSNMEPWDEDQILYEEEDRITIDNLSRSEVREIQFTASNRTPEHWRVNFMVDPDDQVDETSEYTIDGDDNNLINIEEIFGWYEDKTTAHFPWPLADGQTKVTSVLNEPRYDVGGNNIGAPGRFHNGVDIDGNIGDDVYAISSSIITNRNIGNTVYNKGINTDLFDYFHIDRLYEVYNNRDIGRWLICSGDKFAQLEDYVRGAHLHVNDYSNNSREYSRMGASINPLRQTGFLPYYNDGYGNDPVWPDDPVRFFKNLTWNWYDAVGSLEEYDPDNLKGEVDIVLKVKDPPSPGICRAGIYGYRWYLRDQEGVTVAQSQPVLGNGRYIGEQGISERYFRQLYFERPSDKCDYFSIIITHQPHNNDGALITECIVVDYRLFTTELEDGAYDLIISIVAQGWLQSTYPIQIPVIINNNGSVIGID